MNILHFFKATALGAFCCATTGNLTAQIYTEQSLPANPTNQSSIVVRAADLDNDGDQDLILGNEFEPNTALYNQGMGNFIPVNNGFSDVHNDTDDIGVGDFDGDGDMDVIFINQGGFGHEYYHNDGTGNFEIAGFLPATNGGGIAVGDLNNDGFLDIVIGNLNQQNFCLINDGTGNFINETTERLPAAQRDTDDLKLADVDNDGDLDLFVANRNGNRMLINNGDGIFEDETSQRIPQGIDMDTRKACFGDVNGDGWIDLFLANVQFSDDKNPQNRLYINEMNGFFTDLTASRLPQLQDQTTNAAFEDFDGDGALDLLITNVLENPIQALKNSGNGTFTIRTSDVINNPPATEEAWGIAIADFNEDGFNDIYVSSRFGQDTYLTGDPEGELLTNIDPTLPTSKNTLFPNPVNTNCYLQHPENFTIKKIQLFTSHGQLLQTLTSSPLSTNKTDIHFPKSIPNGIYYLKIQTLETITSYRIIKQ